MSDGLLGNILSGLGLWVHRYKRLLLLSLGRYCLTILVVAGTTIVLHYLNQYLSLQVIGLLYLMPVVLCARLWGLGPGILTAIFSFLSLNYFFTIPLYTLAVHRSQDLLALFVFLSVAIVISQLLSQDQKNILEAMARELDATRLYELSLALSGLQETQTIIQALAEEIHETFAPEMVKITLIGDAYDDTNVSIPTGLSMESPPDFILPLSTARGQQGVVEIWRKAGQLTPAEGQLFRTYTSQGALAIERAKLAQSENRAKVLEESDRLKTSLLSLVSHELRTPLVTIKASISSLNSGAIEWETDARKDLLEAVEEETDHLNQLVGNLLDMSRIETGVLKPQRKWNSLMEIVGGVIKRMSQIVRQHKVVIDIPSDLPLLPVDYVQMEQVFTNLTSNSAKYAPPETEICIRARVQLDQTVLVQVTNQGPRVLEQHLERIFDKFYRVTAADKVTGTGLGLSICKGIIEAHGGRIWAENGADRFLFCFTLPITWEGALPHNPREVS